MARNCFNACDLVLWSRICLKVERSPDQHNTPCRGFSRASKVNRRPTGELPAVLPPPERSRSSSLALPDHVSRLPGLPAARSHPAQRAQTEMICTAQSRASCHKIAAASATFTLLEQIKKKAGHSPHQPLIGIGTAVPPVVTALLYSFAAVQRPQSPFPTAFIAWKHAADLSISFLSSVAGRAVSSVPPIGQCTPKTPPILNCAASTAA